jgi:hypothetical protein
MPKREDIIKFWGFNQKNFHSSFVRKPSNTLMMLPKWIGQIFSFNNDLFMVHNITWIFFAMLIYDFDDFLAKII